MVYTPYYYRHHIDVYLYRMKTFNKNSKFWTLSVNAISSDILEVYVRGGRGSVFHCVYYITTCILYSFVEDSRFLNVSATIAYVMVIRVHTTNDLKMRRVKGIVDTRYISPANHNNIIGSCRRRPLSENHPTIGIRIDFITISTNRGVTPRLIYLRIGRTILYNCLLYFKRSVYCNIILCTYLYYIYYIIRAHACEWRISAGRPPFYFSGSQHDNDIMM